MICRSTCIRSALRSRQRGFLLNPYRFGAGGGGIDPYWANVAVLLHLDGDAVDAKGHLFTPTGTVTYGAGRFGQAMVLATGDSGLYGPVPAPAMNLPGDFTIECWLKAAAELPPSGAAVLSRFAVNAEGGWQLYISAAGRMSFYQYAGSGTYPIPAAGPDLRGGVTWHHVAVTREGSALRLFVGGALVGTGTSSANYSTISARLSVGYQVDGAARYPFRGAIDEVRITAGVARYTAAFTPPVAPFPQS